MDLNNINNNLAWEYQHSRHHFEKFKVKMERANNAFYTFGTLQNKIKDIENTIHYTEYPKSKIDIKTYLSVDMKKIVDYIFRKYESTLIYTNSDGDSDDFMPFMYDVKDTFEFLLECDTISNEDKKELSRASKYINNLFPFFKEKLK